VTLRHKTVTIIGLTLGLIIVVLFFITREIVHSGFKKVENVQVLGVDKIERSETRQNVERVEDALDNAIANLATQEADWAQWDDTYRFVVDRNPAYIHSNLSEEALTTLKINFVLMLNKKNEIVFGAGFDLGKNKITDVSEGLKKYLSPASFLVKHDSIESSISGILMLPENPLMIVSRPIVKSNGTGPIRGTLLFAKYLTGEEIQLVAAMTHLKVTMYRLDKDKLSQENAEAAKSLSDKNRIVVSTVGEDAIAGYSALKDLEGKNGLLLKIEVPRTIHKQGIATMQEIHKQGRFTLLLLIISIIATGLIPGIAILFVIEFSVLSRVGRLSGKTAQIGSSNDFSGRVEEEGKDEISCLGASINAMLTALASTHTEIEIKGAELQLLMNTVPAGLLSLDDQFIINSHYSRAAKEILSRDNLAGKPFLDVLGLTRDRDVERKKLLDFLEFFKRAPFPEKDMAPLNPMEELEYRHDGCVCWLRLRYYLIQRSDGPNHILAVIEDITEEKKLAEQVARSQRENLQLKAIAENPDLFREFLAETRQIIDTLRATAAKLDIKESSRGQIHDVFRGVHTIKGVAGSFGLFGLVEMSSNLEDSLSVLRQAPAITNDAIEKMRTDLSRLSMVFFEIVENAKSLLGEDIEKESGIFLRIPLEELKRHMSEIKEMTIDESLKHKMIDEIKAEIIRRIRSMLVVPARRGFARAVKIVPGLIQRLGKNAQFNFEGQETFIDCEVAGELVTPLIHLLRNAFDHGIESPEERAESGKDEIAIVTLSVERKNSHLLISLSDDGRGLDPDRLKSVALKKGVISSEVSGRLTREQAYDLIFRPGFSTADTISDVSGRGVGMDAVLTSVRNNLGGDLRIESEINKGTSFIISIPAS
jgi:PAS domain S-box-containing protein